MNKTKNIQTNATYWLKFYADTSKERNKFFTWKISPVNLLERLQYWSRRVVIKAAWYQEKEGQVVKVNQRIDLETFTSTNNETVLFFNETT